MGVVPDEETFHVKSVQGVEARLSIHKPASITESDVAHNITDELCKTYKYSWHCPSCVYPVPT